MLRATGPRSITKVVSSTDVIQLALTLKMTNAEVVETSVTVNLLTK